MLPPEDAVPQASEAAAVAVWAAALGEQPLLLVRSVDRARRLLLQAAGVEQGEPLGLPANATRDLVEAVKRHGARPCFLPIGSDLALVAAAEHEAIGGSLWSEGVGGLPAAIQLPGARWFRDQSATLPLPTPHGQAARGETRPVATIYGLHLAPEAAQAGALIVFGNERLAAAARALLLNDDAPDWRRALAQGQRLVGSAAASGLAERQQAALREVWCGLNDAAGLPLLPLRDEGGLAHGVALRVPDECDPATFYAYVRGEETPVEWLPHTRPLHYAALRVAGGHRATATELARWLLVPVGPDMTNEEISHAVLGVVKAAEYAGMRWRTDAARAQEYAQMLVTAYGPDHDAYHPLFPLPSA